MTSVSSRPVVRLSSPGDVAATVPVLCGFVPQESVVVLSLRGPRKRLGLTARLDLPPAGSEAPAADLLAERLVRDGASAVAVVVFGQERRPVLVEALVGCFAQRGVDVAEALHVTAGRWTSYACSGPCCPAEGTAVPAPPPLVEAQRALDGRAVLGSRAELVQSLSPPSGFEEQACRQHAATAEEQWHALREEQALDAARAAALGQLRDALHRVASGAALEAAEAARLAVALHDVRVRDEVATWALKRSDALLSLAEQVVRLVPAPYDAPACTLLAWASYARGDGSRVNVALDRALQTDPDYALALLLRQALDAAVPPRDVRRLLRETRRALRP